MRKLFLLLYDDYVGTRDEVKAAIDSIAAITDWRYDLPNSFYLVSEASAKLLAEWMRALRPTGRFVIAETASDYNGFNFPETWHMFEHKRQAPRPAPPKLPPPSGGLTLPGMGGGLRGLLTQGPPGNSLGLPGYGLGDKPK